MFARGELLVPGHLTLLSPDADAQIMLGRLEHARAQPEAVAGLLAMLRQANWRPHLVACATLMLQPNGSVESSLLDALWETLEHGSWVSPQLVAVASRCDPSFTERSEIRLRQGCSVSGWPRPGAPSVEPESGSRLGHSGKQAAAFIATRADLDPPLLEPTFADPHLRDLLPTAERGGELAVEWRDGIEVQVTAYLDRTIIGRARSPEAH